MMVTETLTPVHGGHVFEGTWGGLAALDTATCAACGEHVKLDGFLLGPETKSEGAGDQYPCDGWPSDAPRGQLARVARGLVREAPNDKPNGPTEEALEAVDAAHLAVIGAHDGDRMLVSVATVKTEGDRIYALGEAIGDDCRALRLALEHDTRPHPDRP